VGQVSLHKPTIEQEVFLAEARRFLETGSEWSAFILKGYAGTGKTTVVSRLITMLPKYKFKAVLLAPTGRAAKVMSVYSGRQAHTIHKKIYKKKTASDHSVSFSLAANPHNDTLFIVDEASMIANSISGDFGTKGLLEDLISFVYEKGRNCRILFVGDTAQLPPVGFSESPALQEKYLSDQYDLELFSFELTQVIRQDQASGILHNATLIRDLIGLPVFQPPYLNTGGYKDIYKITGEKLIDGINYAYNKFGIEHTLVICRSNKNANLYNHHIRTRILYREEELCSGDYLMVVKNNYSWLPEESGAGFIANGDIIRVQRVRKIQELYGFRFADVVISLVDYPTEPELHVKIMLNTLTSEGPSLSFEDSKRLYDAVAQDYVDIKSRKERMEKIKADPFINALQVKFAYAVTCHKAQGGQWKAVFVDQGYLTEEQLNNDFLRWLYTALSRASDELYLVNFDKKFSVKT
jgi:exodeoxyribonuclease V